MPDTHDTRPWMATARQSGTGEYMEARGPTKEDVKRQLYGQAYGPQYGSVQYYRIGEKP